MTSRHISVTDDVYELLAKMKLKNECFSDTIRRLVKRRDLTESAGAWSDLSDDEMKTFSEGLNSLTTPTKRRIAATRKMHGKKMVLPSY